VVVRYRIDVVEKVTSPLAVIDEYVPPSRSTCIVARMVALLAGIYCFHVELSQLMSISIRFEEQHCRGRPLEHSETVPVSYTSYIQSWDH
jgi:hypothetical protein